MRFQNLLALLLFTSTSIFHSSTSFSQCILPLSNESSNTTLNSELVLGQSFVSTCTGDISFITVKSNTPLATISDVTLKLWDFDVINGWEEFYTQNSITLNGQGATTIIPLTEPDADIEMAQTYYFTLHHASIDLDLEARDVGTFLNGYAVKDNLVPTDGLSLNDLYFKIEAVGALPVELTSFIVSPTENRVVLNWDTKSETNNAGFEIEKSFDGQEWQTIGSVTGYGDSSTPVSYSFTDRTPNPGKNYYRLKQIDYSGTFMYSSVQVARLDYIEEAKIYPNPATDLVSVYIPELYQRRKINVFDIYGKQVFETEEVHQFNKTLDISSLPDGMYLIKAEKVSLGHFIKKKL